MIANGTAMIGSLVITSGMMEPVLADNELAPVVQVHSVKAYI